MDKQSVDLAIVKRVQHGDLAAFNLLVRKYQHKVANLVSRYVYDPGEVEDISQEVFVKAYFGRVNVAVSNDPGTRDEN